MFSYICLLALFSSAYATTLTEMNCTTPEGTWAPNAIACEDLVSNCAALVAPAPVIKVGTNEDDRASLCFKEGTSPSETQKQAMIKICPKTCGYCCLTPAYTCKNKEFPGVKCETITQAQCKDPKWREIIASECPNVCGMCNEGGCVDAVVECENDKSICRNIDMQPFVQANCKKTCGFCDNANGSSTTPGYGQTVPGGFQCIDKGVSCASWVANGFCQSTFYTLQQKISYCAKSCNLC